MKYLNNDRGVALVIEIVMVALVLSVAGLAVLSAYSPKTPTVSTTTTPTPSPTPTPTPDPTAAWTPYTSKTGLYSLRYAPSWKSYSYAGYATTCHSGLTDATIDLDTQGTGNTVITGCGGDNPGQVHIASVAGPQNDQPTYGTSTAGLYTNLTTQPVTVAGITGTRYTATATRTLAGITQGGQDIEYHFYANGRNYSLVLIQNPSTKDAIADFDLMVTHTIKFSS